MIESTRTKEIAIFDIDGTLADVSAFRHHIVKSDPKFTGKRNFDKFHEESLEAPVIEYIAEEMRAFSEAGVPIVIITSRKEAWRDMTIEWLNRNNLPYHALYMRRQKDGRPAHEIKEEYVDAILSLGFDILMAFDDDPEIFKMYSKKNIPGVLVPGWIK